MGLTSGREESYGPREAARSAFRARESGDFGGWLGRLEGVEGRAMFCYRRALGGRCG